MAEVILDRSFGNISEGIQGAQPPGASGLEQTTPRPLEANVVVPNVTLYGCET